MKEIIFNINDPEIATDESYPVPANTVLPDWYKKVPTHPAITDTIMNGRFLLNMKACQPFLDALTTGYIKRLATDVLIRDNGDTLEYHYPAHKVIDARPETHLPQIPGFLPHEFVWQVYSWSRTPPGYSCLVTHPLNRYDLPFLTMSGVIDTDKFGALEGGGNLPFMLREGFSGIIPAGTPIYQVIPFKRDNWQHHNQITPSQEAANIRSKLRRHFRGAYKRYFWVKKSYK